MTGDTSRRQELESLDALGVPEYDEGETSQIVYVLSEDEHLWALGFPAWQEVRGRRSVADLHARRKRCGIYVLGFEDGERYVGKAVDVVSRFNQHRKTHADLSHLTFKQVPKARLDEVEQHHIHHLEAQGLRLRNIAHMSVVTGERDLDLVVTPDEQERWLSGDVADLQDAEEQVRDDDLRRRHHRSFERFMTLPYAHDVLLLLGLYLSQTVPFPRRTELSFWNVSCLPYGGPPRTSLYCRVSLNMQEVLALGVDEHGIWASFHLASSVYQQELGEQWRERLTEGGWETTDHQYKPGGHDQMQLFAGSFEDVREVLLNPVHADGMQLFNLRLMRKGPTYFGKFHSLDLAEAAMQEFTLRMDEIIAAAEAAQDDDAG
ncbi:GIY-YIG nuclease family protein [Deinococcus arenicola]|uniref:GIY-YIG nuclease family protein n=1 Tax=Deinococcus arenicola TaxID=2994950 RepID=A0ABU4DLU6_9DEIO|nr:GIY-YIG nuclease family protein [Deinococcus sp. ZS9-10]MDV6373396.1 GIY-YIG nuclease family protein [Deinococcus sp. ZS9-10]